MKINDPRIDYYQYDLKEYYLHNATGQEIIDVISDNPRCIYRYLLPEVIDIILESIQEHEFVTIPLGRLGSPLAHVTFGPRHEFNGRYYLIC